MWETRLGFPVLRWRLFRDTPRAVTCIVHCPKEEKRVVFVSAYISRLQLKLLLCLGLEEAGAQVGAASCSLPRGGQSVCRPRPRCAPVPGASGGTFTPDGLRQLIRLKCVKQRKGGENGGCCTLYYLEFFSLWFGTFITRGRDGKRTQIQQREVHWSPRLSLKKQMKI